MKNLHYPTIFFFFTAFLVKHFSDLVEYDVNGFLEKNRDTVSKELVNVVRQSEMGLCRRLMEMDDEVTDKASSTSLGGRVVVSASKTQVRLFFISDNLIMLVLYNDLRTENIYMIFSFFLFPHY